MVRIRLLRNARITHQSGEIVNASEADARFLVSVGSAIVVRETPEQSANAEVVSVTARKRTAKKG